MRQPMDTTVKTYTDANDLQKDQKKMAVQGWSVANVTTHQPRSGIARNVLLGPIGAIAFKPKGQLVATFVRQEGHWLLAMWVNCRLLTSSNEPDRIYI